MTQTTSPPTPHADTLVEAALQVLNTADPYQKSQLTHHFATLWLQGLVPHPYHPSLDFPIPSRPARLDNVKLVAPGMMPKLGKGGSLQSRQAIVHSLVHTESWAIDLSWSLVVELHINAKAVRRDIGVNVEMVVKTNVWLSLCLLVDIIARFGKQEAMPREFFTDFVKVAQDEGRHFMLLAARLKELGSSYGSLPAHDGLWDSAMATSNNLLARLAIEHCVHEARGLDVLPTTIARFRSGKDDETADLLEKVVYPEEITHCAAGVKWFKYLCLRRKSPDKGNIKSSETVSESKNSIQEEDDDEIIQKFHETVRAHFRGPLKPPFNEEARRAAGFYPKWYEPLSIKEECC